MNPTTRFSTALAVLAGALGAAQSPQPLVIEGQTYGGSGTVTGIRNVHLAAADTWTVHVTTDQPSSPSALLREGGLFWAGGILWKQAGDTVGPAGARIAAFDSFGSEVFTGMAWNARLRDTPGGTADDEAVYFEDSLWIQEGPIEAWPTTDFPQGSRWISFADVRCSSQSGEVLLRGRADDPTVPGADETFVAFGYLCGTIGMLCDLTRLGYEGGPAPGTAELIEAVRLEPGAAFIAPSLHAVWSCDLQGAADSDGCIYKLTYYYPWQHAQLAREGKPSPVAGRNWGPLEQPGVYVNSQGSWTLRATLDASDLASDAIVIKNDTVVAREGGTLPAIAPFTFDDFGRGRALLDENDHVVWYGRWNEPGGSNEALFRDDQILVRAGQTTVGGRLLVKLSSGPDDVAITPDGKQLLFKGTLEGGVEGAFLLNLP